MGLSYAVADRLSAEALSAALKDALTGAQNAGKDAVLWEDRGAQILMHVGSLAVRFLENTIVVAIDTETAEFGLAPLIVRFQLGSRQDPAGLVASTDARVLGHPAVAARWGSLYRGVVWSALLRLVDHHATERGVLPHAISLLGDHIRITTTKPFVLREIALRQLRASRGSSAE